MNTELDSERMIENPNNLKKRELPHLGLDSSVREPSSEDATIQHIRDPLHRHLPLLLHRLVVVRRDEDFPGDAPRIEEAALRHESEEPVAVPEVVRVEQRPHLAGVETGGLGELRRQVIQARVGG